MIDAQKVAELFDRHAHGLSIYAAQWTELADDCVQEAFCDLARQSQVIHNPASWLFRAVRNRALNSIRSESRRRRRERIASKLELETDACAATLDRMVVAEAMETLTDDLQEIVLLRIWSNLTLSEVAETLDSSTATIHRQYRTALEQLRNHFEISCAPKNDSQTNS